MRATAFETIVPDQSITALPVTLVQRPSRSSPIFMVLLVVPVVMAMLMPYSLIAVAAARDSSIVLDRGRSVAQIMIAFALWSLVFGWPIVVRLSRIWTQRTVHISGENVRVVERTMLGEHAWSKPLSSYRGVAHHIRSSVGGTRHELLLIHKDKTASILLRASPMISRREIDDVVRLLGCREIAPQVFYGRHDFVEQPLAA